MKKILFKMWKCIRTPRLILLWLLCRFPSIVKNDERYICCRWYLTFGTRLNLKCPQTFREKLNWLKLHYHHPDMSVMVDKYEVKSFVADRIGKKHIVPLLGVWNCFDDINFAQLPDRFVLKCTHDSHSFVIVKNKRNMDLKRTKRIIERGLHRNFYYICREWPYKKLKPRIIAETFLEEENKECLTDYKFFCFNGEPFMMYVSNDIASQATTDFFDMNYKRLSLRMKDPNSKEPLSKPAEFEEMKSFACKLSAGFPHVRVDFYIINHVVYFGELTFFHNGGFFPIYPSEWDFKLGNMIKLPDF